MDEYQLRAFRHKRHLIANSLQWDETIAADLRKRHLLSRSMFEEIEALLKDTSNFTKMVRYLDLLEENAKTLGNNVFVRFCEFLSDRAVHGEDGGASIVDQLRTELKAERHELPVEGYLAAETAHLVEAEFAGQGRTEAERREMINNIVARLQVHKEVWRRDIAETGMRLSKQLADNVHRRLHRRELVEKMRTFLQAYRSHMPDHLQWDVSRFLDAVRRTSTSEQESGNDESEYDEDGQRAAEEIRFIIDLCKTSLGNRQSAMDDKKSGMAVLLGGSAEEYRVRVESAAMHDYRRGLFRSKTLMFELERRNRPLEQEWMRVSAELDEATEKSNQLAVRLAEINAQQQSETRQADIEIDVLERQLTAEMKHGRRARRKLHEVGVNINAAIAEINRYRGRSKVMENARRLGYAPLKNKTTEVIKNTSGSVGKPTEVAESSDHFLPEVLGSRSVMTARTRVRRSNTFDGINPDDGGGQYQVFNFRRERTTWRDGYASH